MFILVCYLILMVNLKKCITKQVNQGRKALFGMLAKARRLHLDIDIQLDLFNKLVVPVLLYGSEVWGFEDISLIEIFHRRFLKSVLKLNKSTANCMVYGKTGCMSLLIHVQQRMVAFWCRLITGPKNKLSYTMYRLVRKLHYNENNGFNSTWIEKMEAIFANTGLNHIWMNEGDGYNANYIKSALKLKLEDIFKQEWNQQVQENSQCVLYRMFKSEFHHELYLTNLSYVDRITLTKFRCRNNDWYKQIRHVSDKCQMCVTKMKLGMNIIISILVWLLKKKEKST